MMPCRMLAVSRRVRVLQRNVMHVGIITPARHTDQDEVSIVIGNFWTD